MIACPIGKNGGVDNLTATGALPRIEGANEVVELFSEHPASAFWAFHIYLPLVSGISQKDCANGDFTDHAKQEAIIMAMHFLMIKPIPASYF